MDMSKIAKDPQIIFLRHQFVQALSSLAVNADDPNISADVKLRHTGSLKDESYKTAFTRYASDVQAYNSGKRKLGDSFRLSRCAKALATLSFGF